MKPAMLSSDVLVDGKPRVFLLAEQRADVADRRGVADRDDVGARRHHLAHQRVAEVDDALEQLALFALDDAFLLRRVDVRLGGLVGFLGRFVGRRHRAAAPGARHRPGDPARHRAERPADRRERRQQHFEDPFRIAADDGQRQEELEDEHEGGDRQADDRQRAGAVDADRARQQRGGRAGDEAEQQPHRDEQQQRIVEIGAEAARPVGPLRGEAERQPHQGAERRFDRAEIDGGAGEQEDAQRDHRACSSQDAASSLSALDQALAKAALAGAAGARPARIRPLSRS